MIAVVPGPASTVPSRLNLLPAEARARRMLWRQWQVWVPTALVALVAAAVIVVPLVQKRDYAIALLQQTDAARAQAEAADGVRREFERLQGDYNYVLAQASTRTRARYRSSTTSPACCPTTPGSHSSR